MQKDLYEFIIKSLNDYKMNIVVHALSKNDCMLGISAQHLSEVPRSVTNKFSSMTENQALNPTPIDALKNEIDMVDKWLYLLDDEEKYMIENFYIYSRKYNTIIHNWRTEYHINYWKKKRIDGLNKIALSINKIFKVTA